MIPALYHKCFESTKNTVLQEAENVCITTDCWTSSITESYIAITGHYITKQFDFKSILLKCSNITGSHTANNLATEIRNVITEWNLQDKVNFAVSDNARNITNAIENILKWKHYGCYAHTLNLIVQKSLQELQPILKKIKKIVSHFKRSSLANEKLLKYQVSSGTSQPKRLIQDVATRWNSTFYMLHRFVELEEAIRATITLIDKDLPVITSEEWQTCR
nr:PREDICTED: zinc finger BED domain-containing protein RICESLEEPER 2-like [Linepithema humile]